MDPRKIAYQKTTGTDNPYLVDMHVDITVDLLVMQSSKYQDMPSHQKAKEDGPIDSTDMHRTRHIPSFL